MSAGVSAVLFDLDGTLADTGPDLLAALNAMRAGRGLAAVGMDEAGHVVGHGSRKLMSLFYAEEGEEIEPLRNRFFDEYERVGHAHARLFDGIAGLLDGLEERSVPWAIVTNKPTVFTVSLLSKLGLDGRPAAVVCSDTIERHKPHPDGLLHVCGNLSVGPERAVYVGDNAVDVKAAEACGMMFAAAGWGYWEGGETPHRLLSEPADVLGLLGA